MVTIFNEIFHIVLHLQEESGSHRFNNDVQVHRTSSDISLEKLISFCGKIYNLLSGKDSRDLRIAGQLFDACTVLKENPLDS